MTSKSPRRFIFVMGVIVVLQFIQSGCWLRNCEPPALIQPPTVQHFSRQAKIPIRRVLLLPTSSGSFDNTDIARILNQHLAQSLRQTGKFEVVTLLPGELGSCDNRVVKSGRYRESELAQLRNRYSVDAVVFSMLNQCHEYAPQRASLSVHLVDTRESIVVSSVNGSWDLRRNADSRRFEKFQSYHEQQGYPASLSRQSPFRICNICCC